MRATGRTTRMLEEAAKAARGGDYVIVAAGTKDSSSDLLDRLSRAAGVTQVISGPTRKVYFGSGSVTIVVFGNDRLDMSSGRAPGAHPSVKTFADHYAAELAISKAAPWAWEQWQEWSLGRVEM